LAVGGTEATEEALALNGAAGVVQTNLNTDGEERYREIEGFLEFQSVLSIILAFWIIYY
jgi:hypothetical protein